MKKTAHLPSATVSRCIPSRELTYPTKRESSENHRLKNAVPVPWICDGSQGTWVVPKIWENPQIINFNRVFHYKPSILGYPYFWKQPYVCCWGLCFVRHQRNRIIQIQESITKAKSS